MAFGGIVIPFTTRSRMAPRSECQASAVDRSVPDTPFGRWHPAHARAKIGARVLDQRTASADSGSARAYRWSDRAEITHTSPLLDGASFASGSMCRPLVSIDLIAIEHSELGSVSEPDVVAGGREAMKRVAGRVVEESEIPMLGERVDRARRRGVNASVRAHRGSRRPSQRKGSRAHLRVEHQDGIGSDRRSNARTSEERRDWRSTEARDTTAVCHRDLVVEEESHSLRVEHGDSADAAAVEPVAGRYVFERAETADIMDAPLPVDTNDSTGPLRRRRGLPGLRPSR